MRLKKYTMLFRKNCVVREPCKWRTSCIKQLVDDSLSNNFVIFLIWLPVLAVLFLSSAGPSEPGERTEVDGSPQSHYIDVEQYTIDFEGSFFMFSGKKIFFFSLKRYYATFQCGRQDIFKKNFFLPSKAWKKRPAIFITRAPQFFFQYCQSAQNQPKSPFLFH